MNLPLRIALRYFFSRKKGGSFNLISVISGIALLGYVTGAAALIVVLSVFNGFEQVFVSLYNNFDADISITANEGKSFKFDSITIQRLHQLNGIRHQALVLEENVLLRYGNRQCIATAKGVDQEFLNMTSLDSCMTSGNKMVYQHGIPYLMAGQGIAYQLALDPQDMFNRVVVYVPDRFADQASNPTGSFRQDALYPSGTFSVQQEVDEQYVLVPLLFLQQLLQKDHEISSIELQLSHTDDEPSVITGLKQLFPESGYRIRNRFEQREAFFKVMKSEKLMSYFILFFILIIAASNTIGSLFIQVIEKQKDIHILSSMGMSQPNIRLTYIFRGLIQSFVGGIIGLGIGLTVCYLQIHYGFVALNETAAFAFQTYPVHVILSDVVLVMGTVLFLGLLTSLYPAVRAGKFAR